jgi:DNA polymerase V
MSEAHSSTPTSPSTKPDKGIMMGDVTDLPPATHLSDVSQAKFPTNADDFIEGRLDLNRYLIRHPAATFFVKVSGDSMTGASIHPDDVLIVDRSLEPQNNHIAVVVVDGELTIKRLATGAGKILLVPESPDYEPLEVSDEMEFEVWGVVTHVIHSLL